MSRRAVVSLSRHCPCEFQEKLSARAASSLDVVEFVSHFFNDFSQRHQPLHLAIFIENDAEALVIFLEVL